MTISSSGRAVTTGSGLLFSDRAVTTGSGLPSHTHKKVKMGLENARPNGILWALARP